MGVNKLSDLVRMIRDITGLPRATMNAPTEFILSESYGIVSTSKQEKGIVKVTGIYFSVILPEEIDNFLHTWSYQYLYLHFIL
jgi:hypothetical protein